MITLPAGHTQPGRVAERISLTAMKPLRIFTAHPASVGESYFGHLLTAATFGLRMVVAGIACLLHGLFPFLFVTSGSDTVRELHAEMAARCERARAGAAQSSSESIQSSASEIANTSRVGA